jgi:GNAT superfamily N-acetyltransferase
MTDGQAPACRPAGKRDLDRLGELILALGRAYEPLDPAYRLSIDFGRMWREHLEEGMASDRIRVPVTTDGTRTVVSFLVARFAPAPLGYGGGRIGLIEGAWVEPDFRRQGRLRAMVADAFRWFEVHNVPRVEVVVEARDADARAAWSALGFGPAQSVYRREVTPSP